MSDLRQCSCTCRFKLKTSIILHYFRIFQNTKSLLHPLMKSMRLEYTVFLKHFGNDCRTLFEQTKLDIKKRSCHVKASSLMRWTVVHTQGGPVMRQSGTTWPTDLVETFPKHSADSVCLHGTFERHNLAQFSCITSF